MCEVAGLGVNDADYQVHISESDRQEGWTCPDYMRWGSILKYIKKRGNGRVDNGLKYFSSFLSMLEECKFDDEEHSVIDSRLLGVGNALSDYLVVKQEHRGILRLRSNGGDYPAWVSPYNKEGTQYWVARYRNVETGVRTARRDFKTMHEASFFAMEMFAQRILNISNEYNDCERTRHGLVNVALQMRTLAQNGFMFYPAGKKG